MSDLHLPAERPSDSRRQRRKREVRHQIAAAARDLFERQGIETTTIGQIAAAADVAEKTFYNHFGTRAELLGELAAGLRGEVVALIERAGASPGTTRARLARAFRDLAEQQTAASPLDRELLAAGQLDPDPPLETVLRALIDAGVERRDVAPALDAEFVSELASAAIASSLRRQAADPRYPLRLRLDQVADLIGAAIDRR